MKWVKIIHTECDADYDSSQMMMDIGIIQELLKDEYDEEEPKTTEWKPQNITYNGKLLKSLN